jgi:hypothetical protein
MRLGARNLPEEISMGHEEGFVGATNGDGLAVVCSLVGIELESDWLVGVAVATCAVVDVVGTASDATEAGSELDGIAVISTFLH